jgi:ribosome-associated toxin RatA of RatAB toxin-antitoxin module
LGIGKYGTFAGRCHILVKWTHGGEMPTVEVKRRIAASPDEAWASLIDIESYHERMGNVRSVRILDCLADSWRRTAWSVLLRGSTLEWVELEHLDADAQVIRFTQENGDLERFQGQWSIEPTPDGGSNVSLHVDFDIGIPLLAAMLNPIAATALQDNAETMLLALDQRAVGRIADR